MAGGPELQLDIEAQLLAGGQCDACANVLTEAGVLDGNFVLADRQEAEREVARLIGARRGPDAGSGVDGGHLRVHDDGVLRIFDRPGDGRLG